MGCSLHQCTISFLILVISSSMDFRFFSAHGSRIADIADNSKTMKEEKAMLRAQIGSRPPRCDRRCVSCGHCEAIQVPTNPQTTTAAGGVGGGGGGGVSVIAYARGDGNSNYKPMSWKCKCGNFIFNP